MVRTMKLLWTIKEDAGVRHHMSVNHIRLSQTSFMSEKRRECFFLHGAHDQLTKRDDVRKTMDKYLAGAEVNCGLFQGRWAVSDDDELVFTELSFSMCPQIIITRNISLYKRRLQRLKQHRILS